MVGGRDWMAEAMVESALQVDVEDAVDNYMVFRRDGQYIDMLGVVCM